MSFARVIVFDLVEEHVDHYLAEIIIRIRVAGWMDGWLVSGNLHLVGTHLPIYLLTTATANI